MDPCRPAPRPAAARPPSSRDRPAAPARRPSAPAFRCPRATAASRTGTAARPSTAAAAGNAAAPAADRRPASGRRWPARSRRAPPGPRNAAPSLASRRAAELQARLALTGRPAAPPPVRPGGSGRAVAVGEFAQPLIGPAQRRQQRGSDRRPAPRPGWPAGPAGPAAPPARRRSPRPPPWRSAASARCPPAGSTPVGSQHSDHQRELGGHQHVQQPQPGRLQLGGQRAQDAGQPGPSVGDRPTTGRSAARR